MTLVEQSSPAALVTPQRGVWPVIRGIRSRPLGLIGAVMLLILVAIALLAPWIAPHAPEEMLDAPNLAPPAADHLLGADTLGRDTLSRLMYGARISLGVCITSVVLSTVIGGLLGLTAGFFLGKLDLVVQRIMDGLMALPTLVLAIVIGVSLGPSVKSLVIAIVIAFVPQVQRVVRASVISVRQEQFVEAARAGGCTPMRILFRHVAPQVLAPTLVIATALMGQAIIIEAAISFVGSGPPPPAATWGNMLSDGLGVSPARAPWLITFPGVAIFLTVFAFNALGDTLRDILDPREKAR